VTAPAITVLDDLEAAAREQAVGEELIRHQVGAARAAGASWAEIAQRLGVSSEAARWRFSSAVRLGRRVR
jgi:hypothetical protein